MFENKNPISGQALAFGFISGFVMAGSRSLAVTITVFSRFRFGDRYFTVGTALSGLVALWMVDWVKGLLGIANMFTGGIAGMFMGSVGYRQPVTLFGYVIPLYVVACIYHLISIRIREWKGEVWWGYSTGVPWLGRMREIEFVRNNKILNWIFSDWAQFRFFEPAMFFVLGQVIGNVLHDQFTSTWLVGASVGLFLNNKHLVDEQKRKLKDMRDAQIESRYLADALAGKDKQLIAGFSHVPVSKEQHAFFFGNQQPVTPPKTGAPDIAGTVQTVMQTPSKPAPGPTNGNAQG